MADSQAQGTPQPGQQEGGKRRKKKGNSNASIHIQILWSKQIIITKYEFLFLCPCIGFKNSLAFFYQEVKVHSHNRVSKKMTSCHQQRLQKLMPHPNLPRNHIHSSQISPRNKVRSRKVKVKREVLVTIRVNHRVRLLVRVNHREMQVQTRPHRNLRRNSGRKEGRYKWVKFQF